MIGDGVVGPGPDPNQSCHREGFPFLTCAPRPSDILVSMSRLRRLLLTALTLLVALLGPGHAAVDLCLRAGLSSKPCAAADCCGSGSCCLKPEHSAAPVADGCGCCLHIPGGDQDAVPEAPPAPLPAAPAVNHTVPQTVVAAAAPRAPALTDGRPPAAPRVLRV
jgi:hypothetical protein